MAAESRVQHFNISDSTQLFMTTHTTDTRPQEVRLGMGEMTNYFEHYHCLFTTYHSQQHGASGN